MPNPIFCGVVTAPRPVPTINRCVDSLRRAGFMFPIVLAEPGSEIAINATTVYQGKKQGSIRNHLNLLDASLHSDCEHALLCEDDILVHPDTKRVLEQLRDQDGIISIYTAASHRHARGLHWLNRGDKLMGSLGLMMSRQQMRDVLDHPMANQDLDERGGFDLLLSEIAGDLGIRIGLLNPSPGIHIATHSAIPGHGSNEVERNRNTATPASFNHSLMHQLFPNGTP